MAFCFLGSQAMLDFLERTTYERQLDSISWLITRERIVLRAECQCERCGKRPEHFEVHHIEYHGDHPSDTPDNLLIALCPDCHDEIHWCERLKKYSKKKRELVETGATSAELEALVEEFGV